MSALMRDMLAIQTAIELKIIDPPPEDAMMPIRRDTASTASNLLDEFEASLLINRVRSIIIRDVRDELRKRSRFGKFLQYSAGAMTIALAVEISAISFLFTAWVLAPAAQRLQKSFCFFFFRKRRVFLPFFLPSFA